MANFTPIITKVYVYLQNKTNISSMTHIELDMIQTVGVGALALIVGMVMTRRIDFLQRFCVPSPVSGGIVFSLVTLVLYGWFDVEVSFNATLGDAFMLAFFTSVGFQSDLKAIKQGGKLLIVMLVLLVVMIAMQNLMPQVVTRLMGVDPLIGMATGSMPMTGGHGTVGGFASVLEGMGLRGAGTIGMAAATFGLIAGSMIGGPLAERIIRSKLSHEQMQVQNETIDPAMAGIESDEASPEGRAKRVSTNEQEFQQYAKATYCILLVMGAGTLVSWLLAATGITFPTYFGALILAAIVRNTIGFVRYKEYDGEGQSSGQWVKADTLLDMDRIISVGNICLSMFLGTAMISLKLWELQALALPLIVILVSQVLLMALFVYWVVFPLLGGDYDAAVLCAGMCGFGLGATPNAMANMSAVCYKYHYTVKPFLIIPIIGAMFADIINTGIITLFLNML
jgi:ESS family glutamate:Na+ symporter